MKWWQTAFGFLGLGWFVALSILLGVLAGRWLDGKLHTSPLMALLGLVLGLILAIYGVYRMLPKINGDDKRS